MLRNRFGEGSGSRYVEEPFWRRLWIALCGGTVLEKALDRAMWKNRFGKGSGSRYVQEPFWRRLWIALGGGTVLEKALDRTLDRIL
jgi:hypothetical protein